MKTTLDAEDILYTYLNTSTLKTAVQANGGDIYKQGRPANDKKEAVVIVSLPLNNEQLQEGIVNVNIFVPNVVINVNEMQDDSQPNHPRLKQLATIAAGLLNDVFLSNSDCGFYMQQQSLIKDDQSKEHFINIRVNFYGPNLN